MDFFTVPTPTFGVLHCVFVIGHDRRKILHCKVTRNPHTVGGKQQLREAWASRQPHRFLLFDRDAKFGADVVSAVKNIGSQPTRTAFRSPWQNGVAERRVGSCRRDLPDHGIIRKERHLKRPRFLHTWPTTTRTGLIWTREGHASGSAYSSPLWNRKQDSIPAETRRPAPSVCSGSVESRAAVFQTTRRFLL
jgi:hypothetical protein